MKRTLATLIIGIFCAVPFVFAKAEPQLVTVGFEEFANNIGVNWSWNGITDRPLSGLFPSGFLTSTGNTIDAGWNIYVDEYKYQTSDGMTFYFGGFDGVIFDDEIMSFWSGVGLSTVTNTAYGNYLNDMASTSGAGNNNSQTYGVFHSLTGIPSTPAITLPEDATLKSIAIANTVYTAYSLLYGDDASDGLINDGDYFSLYIEGQDANGNTTGLIEVVLGEVVNGNIILNDGKDWQTVYFDEEFEGTTTLWFYLEGSDDGGLGYGLATPAYFAFDDLTYELDDDIESP
ncbi:MAG: DUF4465 domain-containing protein [Planctomycetaceae bacterium]|nr:DUF4465 domain-containing protein [Planctomycetaceae bacterium]